MHLSRGFLKLWAEERLDELLQAIVLQPRLQALVNSSLVRKAGALLLEPLAQNVTGPEWFPDSTGYEAFVNKIHIDDFVDDSQATSSEQLHELVRQGVKAAVVLSERLRDMGKYRVFLSLDPDLPTMALRFFERRPEEPWGDDNPDVFQPQEVLMIDTGV